MSLIGHDASFVVGAGSSRSGWMDQISFSAAV
jgi:hypothetical protein